MPPFFDLLFIVIVIACPPKLLKYLLPFIDGLNCFIFPYNGIALSILMLSVYAILLLGVPFLDLIIPSKYYIFAFHTFYYSLLCRGGIFLIGLQRDFKNTDSISFPFIGEYFTIFFGICFFALLKALEL